MSSDASGGGSAPRWLDEREGRAWRLLQMMQLRLEGQLAHELAVDSGLSYPDYLVLVVLTSESDGRLRVFELAEHLGWEKSRLSHHVARMVERGFVTKEHCGEDRRGAFVVVAEAGRQAIAAAAPGHVAAVRRLFVDRLTGKQLDAVGDVAEAVLAALDAERDGAT